MKKVHLFMGLLIGVVLCLATVSWAGEASVFDSVENIIIRAYTTLGSSSTCGPSGSAQCYSLYLEVRDSTGALLDSTKVSVTGLAGTATPPNANLFLSGTSGPYSATYTIHDNNAASSDISLSLDGVTGTTYLFCTDNTGVMAMQYSILSSLPVDGKCGTANNGTFLSKPTTSLCGDGALPTVGGTGQPWTWTCPGTNGGNPSPQCKAYLQTWTVTPAVAGPTGSGNINPNTQQTVNNGAATSFTVTPNPGYSISSVTGCGGSLSVNTYTTGAITANCTVTATFAVQAALPDLVITSFQGPGAVKDGATFNTYITVKNNGIGAAGAFNVKIYWNSSWKSMTGLSLAGQARVNGLAPGASQSLVIQTSFHGIVTHSSYYTWGVVDADNEVPESNETNNAIYEGFDCL